MLRFSQMLLIAASLVWQQVSASTSSTSSTCVELSGIVSGGGDGLLDFDNVSTSLEKEPWDLDLAPMPAVATCSEGLETPVSMRNLLGIDTATFSIAEMFHPNGIALDIFGDKATSDERRRCYPEDSASQEDKDLFDLHLRVAILYAVVYGGLKGMPFCLDDLDPIMTELDLPLSLLDADADITTPWGLAKQYVDETFAYLDANDGWNADGSMSREFNKIPFSDYAYTDSDGNSWTPYEPKNSPWEFKKKKRYQPLLESDGYGYISSQMHVTPHVAAVGRFYGFSTPEDEEAWATRIVANPKYKYKQAALDVIEESRLMATDDDKKIAIEFFDNKFTSLIPLKIAYFLRDPTNNTPQDFYRLTLQVQLGIYNGVVLTWKEKVRHDLPRPPSIIKHELGGTLVEAWAGDELGAQEMRAEEWEAFVRTMPHSEYPSASSCICQIFAEQLITYTGSDTLDPPLEFPLGDDLDPLSYDSWTEVSETCANSRLWGGMHFADAVPAGADLCGGYFVSTSVSDTIYRLVDGDESAAIFKANPGEIKVRHV